MASSHRVRATNTNSLLGWSIRIKSDVKHLNPRCGCRWTQAKRRAVGSRVEKMKAVEEMHDRSRKVLARRSRRRFSQTFVRLMIFSRRRNGVAVSLAIR